jgi:hypothetical protein
MPGFRIYLISLLLCQHFYLVANAREKAIPLQQVEADFLVTTSSDWIVCPASTPLAVSRQPSWPVRGSDRPLVVAGDNQGAMALEATRKLSHRPLRSIAITGFF